MSLSLSNASLYESDCERTILYEKLFKLCVWNERTK